MLTRNSFENRRGLRRRCTCDNLASLKFHLKVKIDACMTLHLPTQIDIGKIFLYKES